MPGSVAVLPPIITLALRPVPIPVLRLGAQTILDHIITNHPSLLKRLGPYGKALFLIDPTDLPFVFRLCLGPDQPTIDVHLRGKDTECDAHITGPLAALIGLVHGAYDGDALFFSRDLVVTGNTEAIVALRNAIDDAELDLVAETAGLLGPFRGLAERSARVALPTLEHLTGMALSRVGRTQA